MTYKKNDVPITGDDNSDLLEWSKIAEKFTLYLKKRPTPITIGLQGDWGSGKTSFMNLVKFYFGKKLKKCNEDIDSFFKDKVFHIKDSNVDFYLDKNEENKLFLMLDMNAWMFSKSDDISLSMMGYIEYQLRQLITETQEPQKNHVTWLWNKLKPLAEGVAKHFTSEEFINTIKKSFDYKLSENAELVKEIDLFRIRLKTTVKDVIEHFEDKQLVIRILFLIDDLDRISPAKVFELTEALKLFLDLDGCIFLLLCDMEVIKEGISKHLDRPVDDDLGKNYLDKIIQVVYEIPKPGDEGIKSIFSIFDTFNVDYASKKEIFDKILIIFPTIKFNIRTLKRLLNSYELNKALIEKPSKDLLVTIFFLHCVYQYSISVFNDLYDAFFILKKDKTNIDFIKEFAKKIGFTSSNLKVTGKQKVTEGAIEFVPTYSTGDRKVISQNNTKKDIINFLKDNEFIFINLESAFQKSSHTRDN